MAYKLVNETNGKEKTKFKTINKLKLKDFENEEQYLNYLQGLELTRDFEVEMFNENIQMAKTGKIVICENSKQVNDILECFDKRDHWFIENVEGTYYIITDTTNAKQVNKYKKFKEALKRGEIVDIED